MKYLVANWKSHKSIDEAVEWLEKFVNSYQPKSDEIIIISPPFPYLFKLSEMLKEKRAGQISLATQDISPFPLGAYTGAVAAEMIKGVVEVVIVGHSERRHYFHESHQEVANKVTLAQEVGLRVILCVDEPYAQEQLAALESTHLHNLVIAYEPLEAIGTGKPQEPEQVTRVVEKIQQLAPKCPILYGGSVNPENVAVYMNIPGISGMLVGGASLEVDKFIDLLRRS